MLWQEVSLQHLTDRWLEHRVKFHSRCFVLYAVLKELVYSVRRWKQDLYQQFVEQVNDHPTKE